MRYYTPRPNPHKGPVLFFLGMWFTFVVQLLMR